MNDLDVPVGLGIARAELPEGCGRNGGRNGGLMKGLKTVYPFKVQAMGSSELGKLVYCGIFETRDPVA